MSPTSGSQSDPCIIPLLENPLRLKGTLHCSSDGLFGCPVLVTPLRQWHYHFCQMSEKDDAPLVCTPQAIPAAQQTKSPGRSPYLGDMVYVHDGLQWGEKCWRVDELIEDQLGVTMAVVECGAESRTVDLNSLCVVPTLVEQQQEAPAEPSPNPTDVTRSLFPGADEGSIASGLEDDAAEKGDEREAGEQSFDGDEDAADVDPRDAHDVAHDVDGDVAHDVDGDAGDGDAGDGDDDRCLLCVPPVFVDASCVCFLFCQVPPVCASCFARCLLCVPPVLLGASCVYLLFWQVPPVCASYFGRCLLCVPPVLAGASCVCLLFL